MSGATKAVILSRVSTREQEEGYSIEAQLDRLREYCRKKNLRVVKEFVVVESSTKGERRKFMEMIAYVKKHRQPVAIVADKIDRIQRSFRETPLLDDLVNRGKAELHFHVENCIIHRNSTSMERMMWNIGVLMAQNYVDSLRDNVNRGIGQKLKNGEWISTAPIGYLNIRDENDRADIIVDEERAPLVIRLFETYATGAYTLGDMVRFAKDWGLRNKTGLKQPLRKSHLHMLFQNPFYHGTMRLKKDGSEYPHRYPPLISRELFNRCEEVRLGWDKKQFKYGSKEFVFRGILTCATSGRTISSETKTKTNLNGESHSWTYLSSWNPDNPDKKIYMREEDVLAQVEEALASLQIRDVETFNGVISYIKRAHKAKMHFHDRKIDTLKWEHTKIVNQLNKLLGLLTDEVITRDEYESKKRELKDRQYEIDDLMRVYDEADDDFSTKLANLVSLASGSLGKFRSSNIAEKREIMNFVFQNLRLNGKKLEYTMRSPFNLFQECTKMEEWRKLVDRFGTDLELRLVVCRFLFSSIRT